MSRQTGATTDHNTTRRAARMRRNVNGWSIASRIREASAPKILVAGTSEYIQLDSTKANARLPWSSKTLLTTSGGRKNHAELIIAALRETVSRVSKGGREIRRYSWPMAWTRVVGRGVRKSSAVIVSRDESSGTAGTIGPYTLARQSTELRSMVSGGWRRLRPDAMMPGCAAVGPEPRD